MAKTTQEFILITKGKMETKGRPGKKLSIFAYACLAFAIVLSVMEALHPSLVFTLVYVPAEVLSFIPAFVLAIRDRKRAFASEMGFAEYNEKLGEIIGECPFDILKISGDIKKDIEQEIGRADTFVGKIVKMSGVLCTALIIPPVGYLLKQAIPENIDVETTMSLVSILVALAVMVIIIVIFGYIVKENLFGRSANRFYISVLDDIQMLYKK